MTTSNIENEDLNEEKLDEETATEECAEAAESAEAPADESDAPEASASLEDELKAEKEKYLRLLAEYDNYRKRSQKERDAMYTDIRSDTILKILPVYDNLARALKHDTEDTAFYKGVEMTMTQLLGILEKMGITPIPALGEKFDPNIHNAVMHVEDENYGESEIIEEFEKGFILGEKVIRYSMVKVAN